MQKEINILVHETTNFQTSLEENPKIIAQFRFLDYKSIFSFVSQKSRNFFHKFFIEN